MDHHQNTIYEYSSTSLTPFVKKTPISGESSNWYSNPKLTRSAQEPSSFTKAVPIPRFSTIPVPPPKRIVPKEAYFLYRETGYWKDKCPNLPKICTLIQEIDLAASDGSEYEEIESK